MRRRVVITGLGAVTPLGLDMQSTWDSLLAGKSCAAPITSFDVSQHSTRFACQVRGFRPEEHFSKLELRRFDQFVQFNLVAAAEAFRHSGLALDREDPTRAGCILGTGIGGIFEFEATHELVAEKGVARISPFFIPKIICNSASGQAAIRFNLQGTNFETVSACASSSHAMGMALRAIQWDEADVMLTGGAEGATSKLGLGGFCAMKALSTRNDDPARASRPFDRERDGFVMGEGAACLIFEELEHARRRGAKIFAEVLGFGSTDDAHHITAPREDADGSSRAIRQALTDAGVDVDAVQYVNAHGTSTQLNDKIETLALKKVFGDRARRLQISSTKSMLGHLLGASGAVELAATALSIDGGRIHPTINYENPDPECDLDYVPNEAREARVKVAISNSLGFGGHNTCLVVGALDR